ncbi:MAG: hypothetical protein KDA64_00705 [Rhodospirillaceae bacterium]|nr:hypothetical protein [Rhodospirillaceae bacterium]
MALQIVDFNKSEVGLVVRGKRGPDHQPWAFQTHVDCIFANGAPVGYFGNSELSISGSGSSGMGMSGIVFDYPLFLKHRRHYVDLNEAKAQGQQSTALLVEVSMKEAMDFGMTWLRMKANPDTFNIVGHNCASHASLAFIYSRILDGGINGLDTPNNLYNQILERRKPNVREIGGYLGFREAGFGKFQMLLDDSADITAIKPPDKPDVIRIQLPPR